MDSSNPFPPSPTESVGPPSYEFSVTEKQRVRASASTRTRQPIVDEDGFLFYDAEAFEAVANSYSPAGPSSPRSPDSLYYQKQDTPRRHRPRLVSVTPLDSGIPDDLPPPFSPSGLSASSASSRSSEYGHRPSRIDLSSTISRPNSPLASPPAERSRFPYGSPTQSASPRRTSDSYHLPQPAVPVARPAPRPAPSRPQVVQPSTSAGYRQSVAYSTALDFDPHVAYTDFHSGPGYASALYNPLVAAHMPGAKHTTHPRSDSSAPLASAHQPAPTTVSHRPSSLTPSRYPTSNSAKTSPSTPTHSAPFIPTHQPTRSLPSYPPGGTASVAIARSHDRPSSVPGRSSISNPSADSRTDGSQWATSEAQLLQHLYGR